MASVPPASAEAPQVFVPMAIAPAPVSGGGADPSGAAPAPPTAPATSPQPTSAASGQAGAGAASLDTQIGDFSTKVQGLQSTIQDATQQAQLAVQKLGANAQPSADLQAALIRVDVFSTLLDVQPQQAAPAANSSTGSGTDGAAAADPQSALVADENSVTSTVSTLVQQAQSLEQAAQSDTKLSDESAKSLAGSLQVVHKAMYAVLAADAAEQQLSAASTPANSDGSAPNTGSASAPNAGSGGAAAQSGSGSAASANAPAVTATAAPATTTAPAAAAAAPSPVNDPTNAASMGSGSALGALAASEATPSQQSGATAQRSAS